MKHNSYYPTNVPEQIIWLTNFFNKLIIHAPALGITQILCAAAVADARWLIYLFGSYQPTQRAWSRSNTDFLKAAQSGTGSAAMVLPAFVPPPLPVADPAPGGLPAVVPVLPGALNRIFSLVQTIKESSGYSPTIATDLRIVGTEITGPDLDTIQPGIKVKIVGGKVFIDWGWDGNGAYLDMIQIQVDRGQGWADLTYDTTPGYTDTHPFPAALTTWKYRAIYRVGDEPVGVWSAVVSIVVGG